MTFLLLIYLEICVYGLECDLNHTSVSIMDMDEINSLIFQSSFADKKPIIINSQLDDWYSNTQFFSIKNLYLNYGQDSFECGTSTDLAMINRKDVNEITLKLYLRKSTYNHYQIFDPYFIANNVNKIGLKSLDLFHKIDTHLINAYTVLLGKVGSGISFQTHGSIWIHQITGKTKIFLYPPFYAPVGGALDWTAYTSKQWNDYILPYLTEKIIDIASPKQKAIRDIDLKSIVYDTNITSIEHIFDSKKQPLFTPYKPLECILSTGQLLYIPKLWWYSTLNIKNKQNISISMIMQTDTIGKESGIERRLYHDSLRQFKTGFEYMYHYNDAVGAKQYLEKSLLVDPTFISSYVVLSDAYINQAQRNKEHLKTVQRFLKIAYLLNPDYELVRKSLMGLLQQTGDLDLFEKVKHKQKL